MAHLVELGLQLATSTTTTTNKNLTEKLLASQMSSTDTTMLPLASKVLLDSNLIITVDEQAKEDFVCTAVSFNQHVVFTLTIKRFCCPRAAHILPALLL